MITVPTDLGDFLCWEQDALTKALQRGEWWDRHLLPAIDRVDRAGWAIDLGANIGWFTIYLARRFDRVLAVEAHHQTAGLLHINLAHILELEQQRRVQIVQRAAYDHGKVRLGVASRVVHGWSADTPTVADLNQHPHAAGLAFVPQAADQEVEGAYWVETVRVDDLVPLVARVRLIKIDVQGATLRALYGCQEVIQRDRPTIVFEYEPGVSAAHGDGWDDYVDFFQQRRYTLTRIDGPWEDFVAVPQ